MQFHALLVGDCFYRGRCHDPFHRPFVLFPCCCISTHSYLVKQSAQSEIHSAGEEQNIPLLHVRAEKKKKKKNYAIQETAQMLSIYNSKSPKRNSVERNVSLFVC